MRACMILTVTDETLEEVISQRGLVVVDFWAPWCLPCRILLPTIEKLAKKYAGRVVFAKLNVDDNLRMVEKYNIVHIPTVLVFKGGELVERVTGVKPAEYYEALLNKHF